jgi:PEP-CTERM motif
MKSKIKVAFILLSSALCASSATLQVGNVTVGPGSIQPRDTLFASSSNALLSGTIVTIGYFDDGFVVANNLSTSSWGNLVDSFNILGSEFTGNVGSTYGVPLAGYVEGTPFNSGPFSVISNSNPEFVGRILYGFAGSGADLVTSAANGEIALFSLGAILDDTPTAQTYRTDPTLKTILIGSTGTFTGLPGVGGDSGTYNTLRLAAVPEPSALLLTALGALALLRRKR